MHIHIFLNNMDSMDYICIILYYAKEKLYFNMHKLAVDGLTKFPKQRVFTLLNGCALALSDRTTEACRILSTLKSDKEFSLASLIALNYAYKQEPLYDEEILNKFHKNFKLTAQTYYYAALVNFLIDNYTNAVKLNESALNLNAKYESSIVLSAWLKLQDFVTMNQLPFAVEYVLQQSGNINATLCKVQYLRLMHANEKAINELNKISIRCPEISMPLVEKLNIQLATHSWVKAQETALRIINLEPQNAIASAINAMLLLCRQGNVEMAVQSLQHMFTATDLVEYGNHVVLRHICQLFARNCSQNQQILKLVLNALNKLMHDYAPTAASVELLNEMGQHCLVLRNSKEARSYFQEVLRLQHNHIKAICGLIECQLLESKTTRNSISQQIEYLSKLCDSHRPPVYLLICAKTEISEKALPLLIEATGAHLTAVKQLPYGMEYMRRLNTHFLIQLTVHFLKCAGNLYLFQTQTIIWQKCDVNSRHCICILDSILRASPAHSHALFLRACLHYLCGESILALQMLKHLIELQQKDFNDIYLLAAHIQIKQKQYVNAKQTLDDVLNKDITIRECEVYHLLLGTWLHQQGQSSEAKKCFLTALHLTPKDKNILVTSSLHFDFLFSLDNSKDKAWLYLQLIDTLRDLQDFTASERYMQMAMEEYYGTPEEGQIIIAQAKFLLQDFHFSKALNLLISIKPDQPYYLQAKTLLANIYLKHCKNQVLFSKCYKDIVELKPQTDSYLMLAEAYLSIQEPELAIETYRSAFNNNPGYTLLANKLGNAYVKTHQFTKAIEHYQLALTHANNVALRLDLTQVYLVLKQYKNAEELLVHNLNTLNIQNEEMDMEQHTQELLLLAHVQEKLQNSQLCLQLLQTAYEHQRKISQNIQLHSGNADPYTQQKASNQICLLIAQQYARIGALSQAEEYYQECLKYTPNNVELLCSAAQLYLQMNTIDRCSDICKQLLEMDPTNRAASVMLADILFRKMEFEESVEHFSKLLLMQPDHWTALVRLIQIMRRIGELRKCYEFVDRAQQIAIKGTQTSGLLYCKGLFYWYSGQLEIALQCFNSIRRDFEWGQQAISNMIEIYLDLDEQIFYVYGNDNYCFNNIEQSNGMSTKMLNTVEYLLNQLHFSCDESLNEVYNFKLLENLVHLASNQQEQIELALNKFSIMEDLPQYQNKVGLIYGTALAHMKLKNFSKAKSHLNLVLNVVWTFEESSFLERSWLLIAFIYMEEHKHKAALHFIERILDVDKSYVKAHELAGFIAEKSEMYEKAADYYQKAWNISSKTKPYVGYKLAYCYMKLQRHADAAKVAQQVLRVHGDFNVIKNDILHKCRQNLRP